MLHRSNGGHQLRWLVAKMIRYPLNRHQRLHQAYQRALQVIYQGLAKPYGLSGLLNVIDGVASHKGRVLTITTNQPGSLDKAFIQGPDNWTHESPSQCALLRSLVKLRRVQDEAVRRQATPHRCQSLSTLHYE